MSNLDIDYGELAKARGDIDAAHTTFTRAGKVSSDISGLVGHPGLASKVDEFSDSWDINRKKLESSLEFISESLTSIIDTFRELDEAQAGALHAGGRGR
ncbi:MAG: hypothetical protein ABI632_08205 [Pseudolysinimonas sp.]